MDFLENVHQLFSKGFQDYSLVDAKYFGNAVGKEYTQTVKTVGHRNVWVVESFLTKK